MNKDNNYLEGNYGIKSNGIYEIKYRAIGDIQCRNRLEESHISKTKGIIHNFNPLHEVVIVNKENGIKILSYKQIVEMT